MLLFSNLLDLLDHLDLLLLCPWHPYATVTPHLEKVKSLRYIKHGVVSALASRQVHSAVEHGHEQCTEHFDARHMGEEGVRMYRRGRPQQGPGEQERSFSSARPAQPSTVENDWVFTSSRDSYIIKV